MGISVRVQKIERVSEKFSKTKKIMKKLTMSSNSSCQSQIRHRDDQIADPISEGSQGRTHSSSPDWIELSVQNPGHWRESSGKTDQVDNHHNQGDNRVTILTENIRPFKDGSIGTIVKEGGSHGTAETSRSSEFAVKRINGETDTTLGGKVNRSTESTAIISGTVVAVTEIVMS